jgi:hypothetical protein
MQIRKGGEMSQKKGSITVSKLDEFKSTIPQLLTARRWTLAFIVMIC